MSAEEGAISNERNIENIYNITNYLFQKFNYKAEMHLIKVMCNHNFNIFLKQDSNIYSEKKIRQGLRTRKHYMQIFFWEILWIFT